VAQLDNGDDKGDGGLTRQVLDSFEIVLYRWNLLTDEMSWMGADTALMQATGLATVRSGAALREMREDGKDRSDWALQAESGDHNRFVFAVPTGPAQVTWIEDQARRTEIDGIPHVIGLMRRLGAPRRIHQGVTPPWSEREGRAMLARFLGEQGIDRPRSYILFGIDNLRDLIRALGPDLADEIIAEVDFRITAARPAGSRSARVSSALIGIADVNADTETLPRLARRIMDIVGRTAVQTSAGPVNVTVSAGICHAPRGSHLPADPLANAIVALDEARIGRVEGLRFSHNGDGSVSLRDRYVSGARLVMDAINEGRLTIAYQPVVRAGQRNMVAFSECLARIRDPQGELVPAASFMPAIEHLGLIRQVDREVLRCALATLRDHPGQRLSVNISPQSMHDSEWIAILEQGRDACPDACDRLILEVTEGSAMIDPPRTLAFMNRVRKMGCAFALDDFGAGYTSFKHFRDFRFDAVKIDGSFVVGIAHNRDNQLLLRTLSSIAEHFSMFTVAEFVENTEDAAYLVEAGIDCLQGRLFGMPVLEPDWLDLPADTARLRA